MMSGKKSRPRIAIVAKGVIGGGNLGYGIPVLRLLFERLSQDYDIVLYSFSSVDESNVIKSITVRQITWSIPLRLQFIIASCRFTFDHLLNPFKIIFAVSVYPAGLWAVRMGKAIRRPVILQLIGLEAVELKDIGCGNLSIPWLKKITIDVCQQADVVVAVAEYQRMVALKSLPKIRDITVLPLRVDHRQFLFKKKKLSFPIQFIHIAYYSPIKDQDTMFAAFAKVAKLKDCHLTVIGNGYDIPKVHAMLKALQISNRVSFKGEIHQSEISGHFHDAHILLHPARFETGCAVIQEAMASGVAVCGTRVGILSDIGDEYAMIASPQDAEEFANKMLQLIDSPELYHRLTTNAYRWITTYDSVWSFENYHRFINASLNGEDLV